MSVIVMVQLLMKMMILMIRFENIDGDMNDDGGSKSAIGLLNLSIGLCTCM